MGFWTHDLLARLIPEAGAIVRTQLGPVAVFIRRDGWAYTKALYQVGFIQGLESQQAAEVLNLIGAYPPREEDQIHEPARQEGQ